MCPLKSYLASCARRSFSCPAERLQSLQRAASEEISSPRCRLLLVHKAPPLVQLKDQSHCRLQPVKAGAGAEAGSSGTGMEHSSSDRGATATREDTGHPTNAAAQLWRRTERRRGRRVWRAAAAERGRAGQQQPRQQPGADEWGWGGGRAVRGHQPASGAGGQHAQKVCPRGRAAPGESPIAAQEPALSLQTSLLDFLLFLISLPWSAMAEASLSALPLQMCYTEEKLACSWTSCVALCDTAQVYSVMCDRDTDCGGQAEVGRLGKQREDLAREVRAAERETLSAKDTLSTAQAELREATAELDLTRSRLTALQECASARLARQMIDHPCIALYYTIARSSCQEAKWVCRRAACKGYHSPTPSWTCQIQARPINSGHACSEFLPPSASQGTA